MEMTGICTPAAISRVGTCTSACAKTAVKLSVAIRASMATSRRNLSNTAGIKAAGIKVVKCRMPCV